MGKEELKKKGFRILELSDKKEVINRDKIDFESLDDLVLVHRTNYIPENKTIRTSYDVGAIRHKESLDINGKSFDLNYMSGRNTIHFCLNGEVSEHFYGNAWSQCLYTIITPFKKKLKNKVRNARIEDTYVEGNFYLSNESYILCPIDKVEEVFLKLNDPSFPKDHIIGCEKDLTIVPDKDGNLPSDTFAYSPYVISNIMGKRPMPIGEKGTPLFEFAKKFESMIQNKDGNINDEFNLIPDVSKFSNVEKREIIGSLQIERLLIKEGFSLQQHVSSKEYVEENAIMYASVWHFIINKIMSEINTEDIDVKELLEYYKIVSRHLGSNYPVDLILKQKELYGKKNPYFIKTYLDIDNDNYKKLDIDLTSYSNQYAVNIFLNCFGTFIVNKNVEKKKNAFLTRYRNLIFEFIINNRDINYYKKYFNVDSFNEQIMSDTEISKVSLDYIFNYINHDPILKQRLYEDLIVCGITKDEIDNTIMLFEGLVNEYLNAKENIDGKSMTM